MGEKLEFFYDYVSAYSYLANCYLSALERTDIVYRPMFLGPVLQATGNRPPATVEAKGSYMHVDIRRWADRYGVDFVFNPKFPQNTVQALRLALVAQKEGSFADIHQRLFDAMWVGKADLEDTAVLATIIRDAGRDVDRYSEAISDQAIKDELKANTDEAISRGAFGAPTFYVGDEMYFGNDRFEFIFDQLEL